MKLLIRILIQFFGLIFLVLTNMALAYLLPTPFSKINLVLAVLIVWMLWRGSGFIIWWMFFASFIVELYSTSPFGVILSSSTLAMLFGYWFYRHIFTNRSWYAAIILTLVIICFYRLGYTLILVALSILGTVSLVPWKLIFITSIWEILFTTSAVALFYTILAHLSRHLRRSVVEARYFKV